MRGERFEPYQDIGFHPSVARQRIAELTTSMDVQSEDHREHVERMRTLARLVDEQAVFWYEQVESMPPEKQEAARRRIAEARDFFSTPHEDWPQTPLSRLSETFGLLSPQENDPTAFNRGQLTYMEALITFGFEQHWKDPEMYSRHDMAHSMHTADYARRIVEQRPDILNVVGERYGITPQEALFLVDASLLFHDCGYPHLGECSKAKHTMLGADMMAQPKLKEALDQIITSPNADKEAIQQELYEGILMHGADVADKTFLVRVKTKNSGTLLTQPEKLLAVWHQLTDPSKNRSGEAKEVLEFEFAGDGSRERFMKILADQGLLEDGVTALPEMTVDDSVNLFRGREIDLQTEGDALAGFEYTPVDTHEKPLAALLRIADNMDIGPNRLRWFSKHPVFIKILESFGGNNETADNLAQLVELYRENTPVDTMVEQLNTITPAEFIPTDKYSKPHEVVRAYKEYVIREILQQEPDLSPKERQVLFDAGVLQIIPNFFHTCGHMCIERVSSENGEIILEVDREAYERFSEFSKLMDTHDAQGRPKTFSVPIADAHRFRLELAMSAITMNGESIKVRARFADTGEEITSKSAYPMRR